MRAVDAVTLFLMTEGSGGGRAARTAASPALNDQTKEVSVNTNARRNQTPGRWHSSAQQRKEEQGKRDAKRITNRSHDTVKMDPARGKTRR